MLDAKTIKKLERVTELSGRRQAVLEELETIEKEIELEMTGVSGAPIATVKKLAGRPVSTRTKFGEGKPCCGSVGPNHKKGCAFRKIDHSANPDRPGRGNYEHKKGQRACKNCGVPGHLSKTCKALDGMSSPVIKSAAAYDTGALSAEQYADLRSAMHSRDFTSAEYANYKKIPLGEVNAAIASSSYHSYLETRD